MLVGSTPLFTLRLRLPPLPMPLPDGSLPALPPLPALETPSELPELTVSVTPEVAQPANKAKAKKSGKKKAVLLLFIGGFAALAYAAYDAGLLPL